MVILLVFWTIRADGSHESDFLHSWNSGMPVRDRSGLVQEFLCESRAARGGSSESREGGTPISYVTVGLWADEDSLYRELSGYMPTAGAMHAYEAQPRIRRILGPHSWRRGCVPLDQQDTPWTL
jgi:hypothetical protein